MNARRMLLCSLVLIVVGDVLAWGIQTGWGRIEVTDVRWTVDGGRRMSGLLYVPPGATSESPAPGVLAVHGYINSRETQSGFAIELSRRGYVVLAIDQPGHGYSDPAPFQAGFGGPAGLARLRALDVVDTANIGLEGHSMGGWAVLIAAAAAPDDYASIVIEGSSTGTSGAPDGVPGSPRNLAVVFSLYDEFSRLMWGTDVAGQVNAGEKLMTTFGTTEPVEVGRLYGSIAEGTGQILHQPPVTHPGDHLSRRAIGHAVDWFGQTLEGGDDRPVSDQVWFWKELGTLTALCGMVMLLFPLGLLLLTTPFFASLAGAPSAPKGATGRAWWGAAALFAGVPAVTLFPFKDLGGRLPASALLPQSITNQLLVWAVLVGLISLALFTLWHVVSGRRAGSGPDDYGLTRHGRFSISEVGRSFLLAALVALCAYATLAASAALFTTDFRFWVFAVKPLSTRQARVAITILPALVFFFAVYGMVLFGQLRRDRPPLHEAVSTVVLSTAGFVGLLAMQYTPLFLGGTLWDASEPLWTIIAFQFVPLMTIVGLVTWFFQRRTGQIWVGAFLSSLLVAWIVAASQATQFGA